MPGIKGQKHPFFKRTLRQQMWQTMRIKRIFTVNDLLITVPGATRSNADKIIEKLAAHGIIWELGHYTGGRPGDSKRWRLISDTGPKPPDICPNCKQKTTAKGCGGEVL